MTPPTAEAATFGHKRIIATIESRSAIEVALRLFDFQQRRDDQRRDRLS